MFDLLVWLYDLWTYEIYYLSHTFYLVHKKNVEATPLKVLHYKHITDMNSHLTTLD